MVHNHFAARNGAFDEFGIGFCNPAVLEISQPFLDVLPPGKTEKKEGREYGLVWTQYMLLDAKQIKKLPDSIWLNGFKRPTTDSDWGHYEVGGERLRCREVERKWGNWKRDGKKDRHYFETVFCFEPLVGLKQGAYRAGLHVSPTWTEHRQVDFTTLRNHQPHLINWVREYKQAPRPAFAEGV